MPHMRESEVYLFLTLEVMGMNCEKGHKAHYFSSYNSVLNSLFFFYGE